MSGLSPTSPAESPSRPSPQTKSILLVDDTEIVRDLATEVLAGAGFDAHAAPDGSTALEFLRARATPFDLVITDLTMPNMDGLTLMREIRKLAPRTRVVLMTGYLDAHDLAARATERPDLVLCKPFRPPELLQAVEDALALPGAATE